MNLTADPNNNKPVDVVNLDNEQVPSAAETLKKHESDFREIVYILELRTRFMDDLSKKLGIDSSDLSLEEEIQVMTSKIEKLLAED